MALFMNLATSAEFDHKISLFIDDLVMIFLFISAWRYDAPGAYTYLVKLATLYPDDKLWVKCEMTFGLPAVRPKLTVLCSTLNIFVQSFGIELPRDARAVLRDIGFGLTEDNTFIMVVPRRLSLFCWGIERMKKMISKSG
ncbi:hypothetical protein CRG98_009227 [Punica granatum]|uniref:Uncharacterized protein n=1 Tax=Punica granatum TaxID=22663 RepID=A0A2I0KPD1_PUNGR|nr:hypothetical protein CRG98_009227 [Punica granatum]